MAGLQDQRKKTSSSSTIPLLGFVTSAFFSSSCCLVQVLLNALSLSCAGFQVLTPYKRIWWMTTCAFGWIWWRKTNRKLGARGMVVLALAIVTLSEEALSFANSGGLQRASSGGFEEGQGAVQEMSFTVPKMGCQACAAKIRQSIVKEFSEESVTCTADLQSKTVSVKPVGGIELDSARIIKAIGRAGYTARELQDANPSDQVEL